jgi:putative thioredoxin
MIVCASGASEAGRQPMDQQEAWTFDISTEQFDAAVLGAPPEQVIVVDFWAPWCGPCRVLGPVLEKLVGEYGGALRLAKVNADEQPALVRRFGVRGIPQVMIFKGGKRVGQFTGALPEAEVRRQLAAVAPTETDAWLAEADRNLAAGELAAAEALLKKVLTVQRSHHGAMVRLARVAMARGDCEAAKKLLDAVPPAAPEAEEAGQLRGRIEFLTQCHAAGGLDGARRRLAENEKDLDARYALACCLAVEAKYPEAMEHLLAVVSADRMFRNGAAKDAMVRIFGIVGASSELANTYRSKLASLLY